LDIFNVNIASTAFLLDFAYKNRVRHFVFASSGGVYAQSEAPIEEGGTITSFEKMGYYISSKFSGELLAQSYSKEFKVDIPRFFFIYGPRQKRSMLIPRIVDSVRDGKIIKLDGKDGLMVNPIYVRDASYALEQMIKYEGEGRVYNVGGPEILSIRKIAEIAALSQSREPKFEIAEGGGLHLISNNSLMESNLCVPKYRFEEEIKSIIVQGASQ
jgi:nucleoside-diphosphate-sugar epimerase